MVYAPESSERALDLTPVRVSVTTIWAFGTGAPWGSVTLPLKVPRYSWAERNAATTGSRKGRRLTLGELYYQIFIYAAGGGLLLFNPARARKAALRTF